MLERKSFVIYPEEVQYCRLKVSNMDRVLDNVIGEFVGFAVDQAALDTSPSHPKAVAAWVMVSSVVGGCEPSLRVYGTSELTPPDH